MGLYEYASSFLNYTGLSQFCGDVKKFGKKN